MQRAATIGISFFETSSSDFELRLDMKQTYLRTWNKLFHARNVRARLHSAITCVPLHSSTPPFRIIFTTCYTNSLVENRAIYWYVLAPCGPCFCEYWSSSKIEVMYCKYNVYSKNKIEGQTQTRIFDEIVLLILCHLFAFRLPQPQNERH